MGYRGSASHGGQEGESVPPVRIEPTEERINYEKLKEREPILWHDTIDLYEDELHDHGTCLFQVRVRVMPSGFFVLSRFWMRLDRVLIRLRDTRVHHLFGTNYMLREYVEKEAKFADLAAAGHSKNMADYADPYTFEPMLTKTKEINEKIFLE